MSSKTRSNIVIKSNEKKGYTEIFIDGKKLKGVRSFRFEQDGFSAPILTVDLNAMNISIDCLAISRHKGYEGMKVTLIDDGHEVDL